MARGSLPGERRGGRQKGTPNKRTIARQTLAAHAGAMLPHEFLLAVCQGKTVNGHKPTFAERMDAAVRAAPFYAPKKTAVAHTGRDGGPVEVDFADVFAQMTDEQLEAIRPVLEMLANAGPMKRPH